MNIKHGVLFFLIALALAVISPAIIAQTQPLVTETNPNEERSLSSKVDLAALPSVSPIAAKAQPSVVNLVVEYSPNKDERPQLPTPPPATPPPAPRPTPPSPNNPPGVNPPAPQPNQPNPPAPSPPPTTPRPPVRTSRPFSRDVTSAQGSGFIYDKDGYVITNNHLVEGAEKITVKLDDGREMGAEVVGRDPKTDLALIKLSEPGPFPYMTLGDSEKLRIGDWVVAIGNPFGLEHTVTLGILSARGRSIGAGPYDDFLQTDASINPGGYGGPLLNVKGEVVGISAKINTRGTGISFAIPSKLVAKIIAQLKAKGYVERGWLGVVIQPVSKNIATIFGLEKSEGALIADVIPDAPAQKAGLLHGDVIVSFDGQPVKESGDLSALVADTPPDKVVKVSLIRDKKKLELNVTISRMEDDPNLLKEAGGALDLGWTLKPISPEIAKELGLTAGLQVEGLDSDSLAKDAGVAVGDIILEVDRKPVTSLEDYLKIIRGRDNKTPVLLWARRGERNIYLAVSPK